MTDDRPASVSNAHPARPALEHDPWIHLRGLTAARIGLKRTGASLATGPFLAFKPARARARDAVREPLDEARLIGDIISLGFPVLAVGSAVGDRQSYLMRPDLGRRLAPSAEATLAPH